MLNHRIKTLLSCLLIFALLLCGCNAATTQPAPPAGAAETTQPAPEQQSPVDAVEDVEDAETMRQGVLSVNEPSGAADEIVVSTVDELLSALGSERTVYLRPGTYALAEAADYGQPSASAYYEWVEEYDGFGLTIHDVKNLKIIGHSASDVHIHTPVRYANVLGFFNCEGVSVDSVTAGHTDGPGSCAGAVLYFASTADAAVNDCDLYGCGTRGVETESCTGVDVIDCVIRDCSLGAVSVTNSSAVRVERSNMTGCGNADAPALSLVTATGSSGVAVIGCAAENNVCTYLVESSYCRDMQLLSSAFINNTATQAVFALTQYSPVVEGCAFTDNRIGAWYAEWAESGTSVQAVSKSGHKLSGDELDGMRQSEVAYEPAETIVSAAPETRVENGMREVHVNNVDELLSAIASDTTVYLADGIYDFSEATSYGAAGSDGYRWLDLFDGPGLVISNVSNFHIVGAGAGSTAIYAVPRYADVIAFENCENVSVSGVTAGHATAPGECAGGVLRFDSSNAVTVRDCALFGCGILGVSAYESGNIVVDNTEIYDCSYGAVSFTGCTDVTLTNCNIHDCGEPTFQINGCRNVTNDGKAVE